MTPEDTAAWYARNHPDALWAPGVDPRCWAVVAAIGTNIYNLLNDDFPQGGCQRIPQGRELSGLSVFLRSDLATWDGDEMTRLVLAGHRHSCRIAISAASLWTYQKNPHDFESGYATVLTDYEQARSIDGIEPPEYAGCDHSPTGRRNDCGMALRRNKAGAWTHVTEEGDYVELDEDHTPEPSSIVIWPISGILTLMIQPRDPWDPKAPSPMEQHPPLEHLIERARRLHVDDLQARLGPPPEVAIDTTPRGS